MKLFFKKNIDNIKKYRKYVAQKQANTVIHILNIESWILNYIRFATSKKKVNKGNKPQPIIRLGKQAKIQNNIINLYALLDLQTENYF